jgi:hypothetical protein
VRVILILHNFSRFLIFFGPHEGRHTGVLVAKNLDDDIESKELPLDCFKATTTDNALNMRVACIESNTREQGITCFAHILDWIVNNGFK